MHARRATLILSLLVGRAALAAEPAELTVRCDDPDARVLLDGQDRGRLPFWSQLPAGTYRLEVRSLDGQRSLARTVTLQPGQRRVERFELPAPSVSRPAGAPPPRRVWTWVAAGAALGCGVAALAVGLSARSAHSDWKTTLTEWDTASDPLRQKVLETQLAEQQRSVERQAIATNVLIGTAAVLAVTSVVLYFVEGRRPAERSGPRLGATAAPGLRLSF
jgi:hypothetical protein